MTIQCVIQYVQCFLLDILLHLAHYSVVVSEVFLSHEPHPNWLARSRKTSLSLFYVSALVCAAGMGLAGKLRLPGRRLLHALAIAGAVCAIWSLLRFLRANDEHEQQINYRALTFAFIGTLAFSLTIGFLQSIGFHSVSWLGIPALMVVLWSLGLILFSWRYR